MEKTARLEAGRRISVGKKRQKAALGKREKRRLIQLTACLLLFLTVFFAKGMDRLADLRGHLEAAICADTDFRAAFADLPASCSFREPITLFPKTLPEEWDLQPLWFRGLQNSIPFS